MNVSIEYCKFHNDPKNIKSFLVSELDKGIPLEVVRFVEWLVLNGIDSPPYSYKDMFDTSIHYFLATTESINVEITCTKGGWERAKQAYILTTEKQVD